MKNKNVGLSSRISFTTFVKLDEITNEKASFQGFSPNKQNSFTKFHKKAIRY